MDVTLDEKLMQWNLPVIKLLLLILKLSLFTSLWTDMY